METINKMDQWLPEVRRWGEMNMQSTEEFWDTENTPYDIRVMDLCHYVFA